MNAARRTLLVLPLALLFAENAQGLANAAGLPNASLSSRGRPHVKLERLVFPADVPNGKVLLEHLKKVLRREARHAAWGAGRGSKIEYRFTIAELALETHAEVLRVRCTAFGKLPNGKTAKSHLNYGGDPHTRDEVVKRVLEIVARGVITRLAELERVRRGELERASVRAPEVPNVE